MKEIEDPKEDNFYSESNYNKKQKHTLVWISLALNFIIIIGFIIYHLTGFNDKHDEEAIISKKTNNGELTIAFVRSDTLWENYKFVKHSKNILDSIEDKYQSMYNNRLEKLQSDYNEYIKKGTAGLLSLNQQKATEAELTQRQDELLKLDERLSEQFRSQREELNNVLLDTILNYIIRYNKKTKYTYILEYAKLSGIFYADESYDITDDIINGLNEEYKYREEEEEEEEDGN